jgi:hypothetical protein
MKEKITEPRIFIISLFIGMPLSLLNNPYSFLWFIGMIAIFISGWTFKSTWNANPS